MTAATRDNLYRWADDWCDGVLNETDARTLNELLVSDSAARGAFVDYMALHGHLLLTVAGLDEAVHATADDLADTTLGGKVRLAWEAVYDRVSDYTVLSMLVSGLLITSILLSLALWTVPQWRGQAPAEFPVVAEIVRTHQAAFSSTSDGTSRQPQLLAGDRLVLEKGLAEVAFRDGAVAVLEGPCSFAVNSRSKASLYSGKLAAQVPPRAVGFVLDTPSARITDLGTEFGADVPANGSTTVHVFNGRVEIVTSGSGEVVQLAAGESATATVSPSGEVVLTAGPNRSPNFVRELPRPQAPVKSYTAGEALVHRWSFSGQGEADTALIDSIGGGRATIARLGRADARVENGRVILNGGRHDEADFVALPPGLISGQREVTIECWATLQSIQNWGRVFSVNNGHNTADEFFLCWTIGIDPDKQRLERHGAFTLDTEVLFSPGRRQHIAVTWSADKLGDDQGEARWYLNGRLAGRVPTGRANPANQPDNAFWLGRSTFAADDTAGAAYDELRIYNRALNAAEIAANHELGPDRIANSQAGQR